ncbi:MAG: hypothetical protein A2275_16910 [Bacteroidetes bacterium RIFOXYA12_FULL_35_11]|nr:MAG: hypothetical protein A2X01_17025 [Bacteroidetes bacterium GWF2_35_48]OFY83464.1 MAG: hypothetical protein A2275_16910 [Bacteroidetes bacterium RIFOXYA12_FULL_35_11]OFY92605.1 MAG: hypothetical protein A2309_10715 [Bacteroidetes bacterium RIFOXYB2_FULL_35_7]HBX53358.1 hypothetical protein [Bacteroidales bacterium]
MRELLMRILRKKQNLVARRVGDEYILVPVVNKVAEMDKVYTLNEVGAFIWDQIDGKKTVDEIIQAVTHQYEVKRIIAQDDVINFIKKTENIILN